MNESTSGPSALRPRSFDEFVGQTNVVDNLRVYVQAARDRNEALDHMLLSGPPGLGKTTLSFVTAAELDSVLRTTSGQAIEHPGELAALLNGLEAGDVLFIDELHRMDRAIEEALYPAMEDFVFEVVMGEGPEADAVTIELPPFTLVAATTQIGQLSAPLRSRFGIHEQVQFYSTSELTRIVERSARLLNTEINDDAAQEIAGRSRGTPRLANQRLRRIRDFAQVEGEGTITTDIARNALREMGVDAIGLNRTERTLLRLLHEDFDGGPVGLRTLSSRLQESPRTVETVYEPFLSEQGLIERTAQGRVLTEQGVEHLRETDDVTGV